MIQLHQAIELLKTSHVIAYPTEAMYGLGCDPWSEEAVEHLLTLKKRDKKMGLILVIGALEHARPWIRNINDVYQETIRATWPGYTTWLFEKSEQCPHWVSGAHDTIALRFSAHPLIHMLTQSFGGAIISSSANIHSLPCAKSTQEVHNYFPNTPIITGDIGSEHKASTIMDARTLRIIRA